MPKLEPKEVQKELGKGLLWPFYWIYGPEKLKSRELIKRIRIQIANGGSSDTLRLNEEIFEGTESTSSQILDSARSLSLYPGLKLVLVKDAHAVKNPEILGELMGPPQEASQLTSVCICLAKDLDQRKKFSKVILERAAVVPCDDISSTQKDSWIHYLAKTHQIQMTPEILLKLQVLDPWSLDIVDQELEKLSLSGQSEDVLLGNDEFFGGVDSFLDHFFSRQLNSALTQISFFAAKNEITLPLLGLLAWNVRQLVLLISDKENRTSYAKISPYHIERIRKWSRKWTLPEIIQLQAQLSEIDFHLKQSPLLPLGIWTHLITRFCHKS